MHKAVLLLALSGLLLSCGVGEFSQTEVVRPLMDRRLSVASPFPSDEWTVADSSSPTGRSVSLVGLSEASLPGRAIRLWDGAALSQVRDALETLDGFSGFAPIFIPFSGPLDPASVEAAAFRLVDREAGVTVPVAATYFGGDIASWVVLEPLEVLRPAHRHVVLIGSSLRSLEGLPIGAARRSPADVDAAAYDAAGWSASEVRGAFAFSVQDTTGELLAASEAIASGPPPAVADVTQTTSRVIEGTFLSPDYRVAGIIPPARAGEAPPVQRWNRLQFYLKLPTNYATAPTPYSLAIWAHGLTGTRRSIPEVEDTAIIAIDAVEHGSRSRVENEALIAFIFNDFLHVLRTRDNYRQTAVDNLMLAHLLPDLSRQLGLHLPGAPVLKTDRFGYVGGSLGGIVGGSVIPLAKEIENAIVVVGGAGLSSAFEEGLFQLAAPNVTFAHTPLERKMFFAIVQTLFDRADGVNFLHHAIHEPFPGHQPRNILFLNVIGDLLVPNRSNEIWAWAAGLEWLAPIHQNLYGLPVVDAPSIRGNFVVGGEARTGVAYQYNPDGITGLKRHGYLAGHEGGRRQIEHFFRTALDTGTAEVVLP